MDTARARTAVRSLLRCLGRTYFSAGTAERPLLGAALRPAGSERRPTSRRSPAGAYAFAMADGTACRGAAAIPGVRAPAQGRDGRSPFGVSAGAVSSYPGERGCSPFRGAAGQTHDGETAFTEAAPARDDHVPDGRVGPHFAGERGPSGTMPPCVRRAAWR